MENEILNSLFVAFSDHDLDTATQIISTTDWINSDTVFTEIPTNYLVYGRAPFPMLNITACFNFIEGCQMLLENDADTDLTDGYQNSPLHSAACCGSIDIMNLLLSEYHCDPTPLNCNKDLPIHIAALHNHNDAVAFLVENNINKIDEKNDLGKTPLSIAVEKNNLDLVQYLIGCNSDVTTVDMNKNTLLHIAIMNESYGVLEYLLSLNKININNINLEGITPLHISVMKGNFDVFSLLLKYDACPLILDSKGRSIIHFAIKSNSFDIFEYIIQNKLTFPFQIDKNDITPFHYAAASPDVRFLTALASLDPSLINDNKCGFAPLHIACKHQLFENINFILTHPITDPLVENCYRQNALHIAARSSNFALLSFILEGNVFDLSIPDIIGVFFYFNFSGLHFIMLLKKVLLKWLNYLSHMVQILLKKISIIFLIFYF